MENNIMKSLNTKLALSALAIAMLATPALAQGSRHHQAASQPQLQDSWTTNNQSNPVGTYPNGATRSGSVYSRESGADDNVIR
jgi:hypothetical protein